MLSYESVSENSKTSDFLEYALASYAFLSRYFLRITYLIINMNITQAPSHSGPLSLLVEFESVLSPSVLFVLRGSNWNLKLLPFILF